MSIIKNTYWSRNFHRKTKADPFFQCGCEKIPTSIRIQNRRRRRFRNSLPIARGLMVRKLNNGLKLQMRSKGAFNTDFFGEKVVHLLSSRYTFRKLDFLDGRKWNSAWLMPRNIWKARIRPFCALFEVVSFRTNRFGFWERWDVLFVMDIRDIRKRI